MPARLQQQINTNLKYKMPYVIVKFVSITLSFSNKEKVLSFLNDIISKNVIIMDFKFMA